MDVVSREERTWLISQPACLQSARWFQMSRELTPLEPVAPSEGLGGAWRGLERPGGEGEFRGH